MVKTTISGGKPVFWRGEAKVLPGGYKPAQTFANGTLVKRGTLVQVNVDTLQAYVCKSATVLNGGTTSEVRVSKDALFQVGDIVGKEGGNAGVTISSITTTNADYNVLNLASAITGLAANDVILEVKAANDGDAKYVPNGVVAADVELNGMNVFDVAYDGALLKAYMGQPVLAAWLQGIALKNNANILVINQ